MVFLGGTPTVHVADIVSMNRILIHVLVHEESRLIIKAPFVEGFSILVAGGSWSGLGSAKIKVAESTSSVAHALVKRSVVRRDELAAFRVEQDPEPFLFSDTPTNIIFLALRDHEPERC